MQAVTEWHLFGAVGDKCSRPSSSSSKLDDFLPIFSNFPILEICLSFAVPAYGDDDPFISTVSPLSSTSRPAQFTDIFLTVT